MTGFYKGPSLSKISVLCFFYMIQYLKDIPNTKALIWLGEKQYLQGLDMKSRKGHFLAINYLHFPLIWNLNDTFYKKKWLGLQYSYSQRWLQCAELIRISTYIPHKSVNLTENFHNIAVLFCSKTGLLQCYGYKTTLMNNTAGEALFCITAIHSCLILSSEWSNSELKKRNSFRQQVTLSKKRKQTAWPWPILIPAPNMEVSWAMLQKLEIPLWIFAVQSTICNDRKSLRHKTVIHPSLQMLSISSTPSFKVQL